MARKPKFTTGATAEHWAVAKGAPPRGSGTPITSITRGLVRFWLTASGVPSERAVMLSLGQMTAAWHDTSDATLAKLRDTPSPPVTFDATPVDATPVKNKEDTDMTKTDHEKALDALKRILAPEAQPLDENAVVEIVTRRMGDTVTAAVTEAADKVRTDLADLLEEARAIVNGAPRVLRIDVAGRIKEMPAAPRHCMFDTLLAMVVASRLPLGQMPMLVGPAGGGKTTACEHVAVALGLPFYTDGALFSEHKLTGYEDGAGRYHTTSFRQAFEHGGVYLMDEADRSDPSVPVVLNSALANGFMSFPDRVEPVRRHADFVPLIAANTYGRGADRLYVGANQLDGATTDRTVALNWDYDEVMERALAGDDAWVAYVQAARASAWKHKVRHIISPRASLGGANLRRVGLPFDLVAEAAIWKGLDPEQRDRIVADIPTNVARRAQVARITLAAE